MSRMGLREYARHRKTLGLLGGSLSGVQKAIASGRIKAVDGKVDSEVADAAWAANSDPAKRRQDAPAAPPASPLLTGEVLPAPTTLARRPQFIGPDWPEPSPNPENRPAAGGGGNVVDGDDFNAWRRRLARAQALREERKDLEEQRALIRADEARRTFTAIGRVFSQARESIPAQAAPQLAGLTEVREIERRLRQFLRDADQRVADEIEARFADVAEHHGERCGTGQ